MKKRNKKRGTETKSGDAGEPVPLTDEKCHQGKQILRDLLIGLLVMVLMLAIKLYVEQTTFGEQLQLMAYNLLQHRLATKHGREDVPITIVDISDLESITFNIDGRTGKATPRKSLSDMVEAVAEQGARVIGIDIDFSPDEHGYITPRDPEFFQFCQAIHKEKGVPVFLGIRRSQTLAPKHWLGSEDYRDLAANIFIPNDSRRMLKWIESDRNSQPGPTMSAALASAFQQSQSKPLRWLHGVVEQISEKPVAKDFKVGEFPVDYSPLKTLEDSRLQSFNPVVLTDQGRLLRGKIVILGDATPGKAADTFIVPAWPQPVPGVYLHACAAYTLLNAPLYEFTTAGRLGIDLFLSVLILVVISSIRLYYRKRTPKKIATHRLQGILTMLTVLAVIIIGVIFVRTTRLMWDDFILVVAALLLHPSVEHHLEKFGNWIRKKAPNAFGNLFFERDGEGHK